jgi:hypothetical protein
MHNYYKVFLLGIALFSCTIVTAARHFIPFQDTVIVIPDGKVVKGNRIKPYHEKLNSYSVKDGKEEKTGTVDDTYQVIKINGKKYGLRVAKIILPGREILDSGLVDLATLQPIYHRSHQTTKTMLLNFDRLHVSGTVVTAQKTDTVNMDFSYPLFDSYYERLIAAAINLKNNFLFKYPDFIYEVGGMTWQSGKIEKTDTSTFGKNIWIISYTDSVSGRKTTYWVDDKRQIKQVQYLFGSRISLQRPAIGE